MKLRLRLLLWTGLMLFAATAMADTPPSSAAWTTLLERHVVIVDGGHASRVDYAGMRRDGALLDAYTRQLSEVTPARFQSWDKAEQMAFLINAYNAFTVKLVLTRWPNLNSIKEIGGLFSSPWRHRFFTLLGERRDLDDVEGQLRAPGRYDDPRVHFALNCASIGCPMLQPFAYAGAQINRQLDWAVERFLGDRSRNRFNAENSSLEVSHIFDWYANDFSDGRTASVREFLAAHAALLSNDPLAQRQMSNSSIEIQFLPYDWHLNGVKSPAGP